MRRVRIQRIVDHKVKGFVAVGGPREGLEPLPPTVGKEYVLFEDSGKVIRTSLVVKVQDGIFETQNSFYKITVLDEEPFDLTGGESPGRTQEMSLSQLKRRLV